MTDTTLEEELEDLGELTPVEYVTRHEFDAANLLNATNFRTVDAAYGELRDDTIAAVAEAKRRPPRPARTGAAARINPDDIRLFRVILGGVLIFALAAFAASFNAQYQMAPYTRLQPGFWFLIPLFIEMPLAVLSFAVLVFKRRGESTTLPWVVMIALTVLASTINVAHVVTESGMILFGDWIGATIMGIVPVLILVAFKEFARLAVKPTADAPAPPVTPQKKAARK